MNIMKIHLLIICALISGLIISPKISFSSAAFAQENRISIRGSDLKIPRFVTLKSNRVNMRAGPGKEYPIQWEYQRQGLPLKVIGEFDVWRKVTDHDGIVGWMHVRTLSIKRMVLVTDTTVKVHRRSNEDSPIVAVAEQGVIAELESCRGNWCKIKTEQVSGWLQRNSIWGLLEGEIFE